MSEDQKDCGQEGHVCVCGPEPAKRDSTVSFSGSLEGWIISELEATEERLTLEGPEIFDTTYGVVLAIHKCITQVKIPSRHDEIAAAFKKAVLDLSRVAGKRGRKREVLNFFKYIGLAVFKKLDLDKNGKPIDETWNEYWMELNNNEDKMRAALKAAYGE